MHKFILHVCPCLAHAVRHIGCMATHRNAKGYYIMRGVGYHHDTQQRSENIRRVPHASKPLYHLHVGAVASDDKLNQT